MKAPFPRHEALYLLLKNKQYDACRATADEMIKDLMAAFGTDLPAHQSVAETVRELRDHDRELACLHTLLSRALFGMNQFREAAGKADIAAFLARKVQDPGLIAEALKFAGAYYSANGEYPLAINRLTECINGSHDDSKGDALYNRGFAHLSLAAYEYAVADFEAAVAWGTGRDPGLVRDSRINLAWVLILSREFDRAELVLAQLVNQPGADLDQTLQLQVAHDRLHMLYLQGQGREAVRQAQASLRQASSGNYIHVRAYVALTLMRLAIDQTMPAEAITFGVLAKRLAGQAHRFDLDEEASRHLWQLECQEGTDCLIQPLQQLRQVLKGAIARRKSAKAANFGGVG